MEVHHRIPNISSIMNIRDRSEQSTLYASNYIPTLSQKPSNYFQSEIREEDLLPPRRDLLPRREGSSSLKSVIPFPIPTIGILSPEGYRRGEFYRPSTLYNRCLGSLGRPPQIFSSRTRLRDSSIPGFPYYENSCSTNRLAVAYTQNYLPSIKNIPL